jgi:class I fructose-bisphosphate aldolase
MSSDAKNYVTLDEMTHLNIGKRTRLHRLLYKSGPANGTMLVLPYDQGLEHGPRDFYENPKSADPAYIVNLAKQGNFSAVAFQVGVAEKYMKEAAGEIPLILKLNGKTEIPSSKSPLSPLNATVEDAVRLGADAVGYTLYVGSARQDEDFKQFQKVRDEAEQAGMPTIVWSYPRGEYVEAKGGQDSFWAVEYAARVATELGADVVKLNFPGYDAEKAKLSPKPYSQADKVPTDRAEMIKHVVASAGRTLVLLSGGSKGSDEDVLETARLAYEGGVTGLIFGRNVWQRTEDQALAITKRFHEVAAKYGR